ncbi:unnamed protein product [Rotaria socialis]|uniref:Lysozyme n=1 Tax=Rotaria socialis TaxID=392032 RepID=A0A820DTQ4_9BILA|nr:unnamed protein product [Rotaria socialis]CAF4237739.1 unnamed protein product [Rotaria socialis]
MFVEIVLISIVPTILATIGIDVSQSVSKDQFRCLNDNGYKFAVVRAYRSVGIVDSNSAQTIKNARAAGFTHVDAYLFPCFPCGDAPQQVIEVIDYLREERAEIDRLWLNIEGRWNNNTEINIKFLDELIKQVTDLGIKFGIYTSRYQWFSIMNNVTKFPPQSPLWYAHYDDNQSFRDFQVFGGWMQPSIKQFIGDVKECGVVLDKNFS